MRPLEIQAIDLIFIWWQEGTLSIQFFANHNGYAF